MQQFEGDETLVVVHADDGVELPLVMAPENGVGREGAYHVKPAAWAALTAGIMTASSSCPNRPSSPAWGLRAATPRGTAGQPKVTDQAAVGEGEKPDQITLVDALGTSRKGAVNGGQDHPEGATGQHHGEFRSLGLLGQKLGVAGIVIAPKFMEILLMGAVTTAATRPPGPDPPP